MVPRLTRPGGLLAATLALSSLTAAQFPGRTIDGTGNNLADPVMGAAGTPLARAAAPGYADGLSAPAGSTRPSPRSISNLLCAQFGPLPNSVGASDMVWQWGQFLDHDIDLSGAASPAEPFDVPVPIGDTFFDPTFTGTQVIPLDRTLYQVDAAGVRQQTNEITAWIDASNVYGSDVVRALTLRTLDGTGRLQVQSTPVGDLLPFNTAGLPNAPTEHDPTMFLAGDVRANEQNGLTALHTLFVREHNVIATAIGTVFPTLTGDQRYEFARLIVGAEVQAITYNEFLPALLGPGAIPPYQGYDPAVDASIMNEFSTGAYRFGHSMLSPMLLRLDENLDPIPAGNLPLRNAFFNPGEILAHGIEPLLRGLCMQQAQDVDTRVIDDVRNFLFGAPGQGGFDLASLNVQRGRDHGLADYNQLREDFGLPRQERFADVSSDPFVAVGLAYLYQDVDDVDPWAGILAEDNVPGSLLGPLGHRILVEQFTRLRDGDRYWYQNVLTVAIQRFVEGQRLSDIVRRNTTVGTEIPDDLFHVSTN